MERQKVSSSNINSIGYDTISQTLEIEFHNGDIYQYYNVPENVFQSLMSASSHGSFFHHNIKNNYRWRKIR